MEPNLCKVEGCSAPATSQGEYCEAHTMMIKMISNPHGFPPRVIPVTTPVTNSELRDHLIGGSLGKSGGGGGFSGGL